MATERPIERESAHASPGPLPLPLAGEGWGGGDMFEGFVGRTDGSPLSVCPRKRERGPTRVRFNSTERQPSVIAITRIPPERIVTDAEGFPFPGGERECASFVQAVLPKRKRSSRADAHPQRMMVPLEHGAQALRRNLVVLARHG